MKDTDPEPDQYRWLMDLDPGGPYRFSSAAKEYALFCSAVASVLAGGLAAGEYKWSFGSASIFTS